MLAGMAKQARRAAKWLANTPSADKDAALLALADLLWRAREHILVENARDVAEAHAASLSEALIDRLTLTESRLQGIIADLNNVAALPDPVGQVIEERTLENGLMLSKVRVPLGVMGVIYESRPNVTIDIAGLAIKTGNAAILRGGKETMHSNRALVGLVSAALEVSGLPVDAVQFIDNPDRARVLELLSLADDVDIIIPRGGAQLHQFCREHSRIPVITGGIGICHLFVDESADLEASLAVIRNAKVQRPSVCNALDTLLVHEAVAARILPMVVAALAQDGVTFKAHPNALAHLSEQYTLVQEASPHDFDTEWLALVLGLKVVSSLDEALEHIAAHSTAHSDGILSQDEEHAERFVRQVDSAAVYVNASTRFTDGGQFGLGAEVAVSTQRLHARGPMGLPELTTYKWVARGNYHVRE
jgi:glutamate-5-semialdehyde dehydrogenase